MNRASFEDEIEKNKYFQVAAQPLRYFSRLCLFKCSYVTLVTLAVNKYSFISLLYQNTDVNAYVMTCK